MYTLLLSTGIVILLNKYPIQLPPSVQLDFAGRIINIYQILSHVPFGLKFLGYKDPLLSNYDPRFVLADSDIQNTMMEFVVINILDYVGWIAIFSRLHNISMFSKSLANAHAATAIVGLLGYEQFKNMYLMDSDSIVWNLFRAFFVLLDPLIRGYYNFHILKNY
jgi:hypothetical protein